MRITTLKYSKKPRNILGADTVNGFDVREYLAITIAKAESVVDQIPFPDGTFDYFTAHDIVGQILRIICNTDRSLPFIELMNKIWRILKIGGHQHYLRQRLLKRRHSGTRSM